MRQNFARKIRLRTHLDQKDPGLPPGRKSTVYWCYHHDITWSCTPCL